MEVVIWKVVLPNGMEVKGTAVEDTSPRLYKFGQHNSSTTAGLPALKGAKILGTCFSGCSSFESFCRFKLRASTSFGGSSAVMLWKDNDR